MARTLQAHWLCRFALVAVFLACGSAGASAQTAKNVVVVENDQSPLSREITEYYARRRGIPQSNICHISVPDNERIDPAEYNLQIAGPLAACLKAKGLVETTLYLVTTQGVPLRVLGTGTGMETSSASVDSELTLLYYDMTRGTQHPVAGSAANPFFGKMNAKFTHAEFPIYLVTRLAAYDFEGVRGIIDRSLKAENRGKFVLDLATSGDKAGDQWLREAADALPKDRVILDDSARVLYGQSDVIGYASWGSNDPNRHERFLHEQWLPGAIMTEYVSTNGRTFKKPPDNWNISKWTTPNLWFEGSPQSMTADYILDGATGASGHVDEPYLTMTPRPNYLFPAYYSGRNLAESYYLSIPRLSWMNIVIGDPLCSLGKP